MESRHVRKPSEDTNMSDGGNNSGSERSRRHSPAVVPFERSVRRSALLAFSKSSHSSRKKPITIGMSTTMNERRHKYEREQQRALTLRERS
ncbi:hypothetical protein BGZ82_003272 [Podila clonocystis]|nr:hypothetical protein BGZ82_003272 [Podila clonocystis]